jgi:hypothetical protein
MVLVVAFCTQLFCHEVHRLSYRTMDDCARAASVVRYRASNKFIVRCQ